ncbi:MotA/TolQ/ExbB proton channel [Pseudodesulfovibrio mercurii]|uniref:MotA/TolQ/ExbB proton channel n=1 Tax=Pseudodesulfovibrio mercurii TaxID=641491 RepID=F0JDU5_9BACT|nr:MotA/TolQ/ExbB proton channel family protein [Pseudodesulfovibrio mercurii]EGB14627.1 MotA/TolQ/ExbB proton channel [Pseudodesulfovibrio mercurii]
MTGLLRTVLDFVHAGGATMAPLLLCCLAMWYLILRAWLDLLPASAGGLRAELEQTFARLCPGPGPGDADLADALAEGVRARTRRRLSLAAVFAAAAPLLGLLGTVTGMIETFDGVARFGSASPQVLSSGISQAMISTQTGLVVAVPGLIAVYFLRRRALRLHIRPERARPAVHAVTGGVAP